MGLQIETNAGTLSFFKNENRFRSEGGDGFKGTSPGF
jgi:hypothetical protein